MNATLVESGCVEVHTGAGITLITLENRAADTIAARWFWPGGSSIDPKPGVANLTASVLTRGTVGLDAIAIASQVESLGAGLAAETTADYFEVSLKAVAADFVALWHLATRIVRSPTFPEAEVEREKQQMQQIIRSQQERPLAVCFEQQRQQLFAAHPYAQPLFGSLDSVAAICQADLIAYHQQHLTPAGLTIVVVGHFETEAIRHLIEATFSDWPRPDTAPTLLCQAAPPLSRSAWVALPQETQQIILSLGCQAAALKAPDYAAFKVLHTYLGGGLSSRLFVELREKQGLAYEVSAVYGARRQAGQFIAYLGTAPSNGIAAWQKLQSEMTRLIETPLASTEVEQVQRKVLGQYALGKQTNSQVAHLLGWYTIMGLGVEFDHHYGDLIRAVTPATIQAAVQRYWQYRVGVCAGPAAVLAQLSLN